MYYSVSTVDSRKFLIDLSRKEDQNGEYVSLVWRFDGQGNVGFEIKAYAESATGLAGLVDMANMVMHGNGNDLSSVLDTVMRNDHQVYLHEPMGRWRLYVNYDPALKTWRYVNMEGQGYKVLAQTWQDAKVEIVKLAVACGDDPTLWELAFEHAARPEMVDWPVDWELPEAADMVYQKFIRGLPTVVEQVGHAIK